MPERTKHQKRDRPVIPDEQKEALRRAVLKPRARQEGTPESGKQRRPKGSRKGG